MLPFKPLMARPHHCSTSVQARVRKPVLPRHAFGCRQQCDSQWDPQAGREGQHGGKACTCAQIRLHARAEDSCC